MDKMRAVAINENWWNQSILVRHVMAMISEKLINVDFGGRYEHMEWYGNVVQNRYSDFRQLTFQDVKRGCIFLHSNSRLSLGNLIIKNIPLLSKP